MSLKSLGHGWGWVMWTPSTVTAVVSLRAGVVAIGIVLSGFVGRLLLEWQRRRTLTDVLRHARDAPDGTLVTFADPISGSGSVRIGRERAAGSGPEPANEP